MKKVLVTGGLGFIGSHTVVELQNEGFEVLIIDNLSNSSIEVLDKITSITGTKPTYFNIDLREKTAVKDFFANNKVDGIIHFAASKAVGESVQMPLEYYENNLGSLISILQEMKANNLNNFIFSSSCTVYGQADELPITENAPIKPAESPYGNTKQIGEEIIKDATKISDLKAIALRYFNPIGSHESSKIGELPIGIPQNLIPYVVQTAAGIRKELSVFGSDYDTPDGTAVRDYIHVVDLAKAHIVALKRLIENNNKAQYEIFNLGTGKGNSVLEVINTFEKVTGKKVNYKLVDRREGDITAAYADTNFANEELGWKAELTLDEALLSAWKWQEALNSEK
ncbi:UDP-glucose 4-epimerase GalE [Lutibacter sp. A80]|uniref:UDP-glucose 4-epimerase GalE n=1 Tax=unclassified Lutibacter TaxID=2626258 RepID=UPI001F058502|nr:MULTISPECIES: UDP-glucose 4-epimerase GalE [unclassified Lutibacter]UMB53565.1 UDP-glucose 4-epimerase GalE [Lutibacter sp. A64]UMB62145.1 UDP-glucose 4-epimerase GalE [Lutibacter sp. A80]